MAQTLAGKDQWFVVHVLSGQENKVKENIDKRVKTEEMGDLIYEVLVPTERVSEIKMALSKRSIPSAANYACLSPFSAAPRRWSSNTGKSKEDKTSDRINKMIRMISETFQRTYLSILFILSKPNG